MFLRAVKLSSFGGLLSTAFISRTRQEGGNVQLDKDQLGSCNVKLDTDQLGSCNVKPNVKLKTINDLERPTMTAGPEYYDLNYSNVENSEEEVCDNGDNYGEYSEEVVITTEFELSEAEVIRPNEQGRQQAQAEKLKAAIAKARDLVWCKMYESGLFTVLVWTMVLTIIFSFRLPWHDSGHLCEW